MRTGEFMWMKAQKTNESVHVMMSDTQMICALVNTAKNKTHLQAITTYTAPYCQNLSSLDNPSSICINLENFLQAHQCKDAFISFAISGDSINQKILSLDNPTPTLANYASHVPKNHISDIQYLYNQDGKWIYTLWSIPADLLFRYQMLAHAAKINLVRIVTTHCAIFHAYKAIAQKTFRQSQLALDLAHCDHRFENLIDTIRAQENLGLSSNTFGLPRETQSLSIIVGLTHLFKENCA